MQRGRLRILIGAAAGAGTTYAMLAEGVRRAGRGTDVMVACVDDRDRPATAALVASLTAGRPVATPAEFDVATVLERMPAVALIDELAATPARADAPPRWRDVETVLDAGIDVVTTLTVQSIESLAPAVEAIVGAVPRCVVPDAVLARADQVEMIDISPEAVLRRIAHGNVFAAGDDPSKVELFTSGAFAQLRSLLLVWMAEHVATRNPVTAARRVGSREVVVVALAGAPEGEAVLRRAVQLSQRLQAALVGVHVRGAGVDTARRVEHLAALVRDAGGSFHLIEPSDDLAGALVAFGASHDATQLVLGTSSVPSRRWGRRRSVVDAVVERAPQIDVHVVSHPGAAVARSPGRQVRRGRPWWVALLSVAVMVAVTVVLSATRTSLAVSTGLAVYLLAVVGISVLGGRLQGVVAAIAAPLLANWFLIEPYHTLRVDDPENVVELVVFVTVALVVGSYVAIAAQRSAEAEQARREAASLAALAGSGGPDALQVISELLCSTFGLDGVALLDVSAAAPVVVASSGRAPSTLDDGQLTEAVTDDIVLVASGRALTGDEHRVLRAFVQQMAKAVDQHRMAALAAEADALGRADELRTAILRAVSHDLRTPLAGIKASVSSLRQDDVEWPDDVRDEFLAAIEDETDRLTAIVTNLLDMSRLQAGAVRPVLRAVSLEEVVPAAVRSVGAMAATVELQLPVDLPDVMVDPVLLERVVANLVVNAAKWSPPDRPARVSAQSFAGGLHLYVVDHGPGIPSAERATVLRPFHRLSDSPGQGGVGLGLAIADGLTNAMGGTLDLRDTPGGGLTVALTLPVDRAATPPGTMS